ncbi:hypothetical protein GSU68_12575 [Rathayibacter sp. VKM Ac-2759]|uniref:hypothetical protein n=1 Tax=Rathayibacter sp. VKM Ac-2759 TaxID=2609252 RepID=UPI001317FA81|nr:hypothetical protein [Rathayibacter sp. VKM Ac-2759]QHC67315.1 hypothetical protein GSU68_12575 [Rathayibacter sp. VKM Ac-2759]
MTRRAPVVSGTGVVRALLVLGLLAWIALPIGGYIVLAESTRTARLTPSIDVWSPVRASTAASRRTVAVVVGRSAAIELYAPAWSGIVEATGVAPGAVLRDGDIVATVGGIDRPAVASGRPFGRELRRGDDGDDVAALNRLLVGRDLPASDSDDFTAWTLAGVRALAEELGVPDAETLESFDPAWVVFLPQAETRIATSTLRVGAPAPGAGEVVVTSRPPLSTALLDAIGASEAGEGAAATVQSAVVAAAGERLEVGGRELPLAADRLGVDPSGWEALDGMIDLTRTRVDALLIAEPTAGTWVVPSTAIGEGESGTSCLVRRGAEETRERIAVTVESSALGRSTVSGPLSAKDEVLVSSRTGAPPCS